MITVRPPLPLPDPPLVETALALRPWSAEDAPALALAWTDPEIQRWTGVPDRVDLDAAGLWISGEADRRARGLALDLVIDVAGEVAGEIGLFEIDPCRHTAEIGWWVASHHRGRGLAGRAAALLSQWALSELCVEALVARCHPGNPASAGAARAAGFFLSGTVGETEEWRCC